MKSVTAAAGKRVGAYAVCVPTADNRVGDTIDGFLKNMDRSVDAFAERVRKDPKLKNGFNAIGLSQGNNIIRGYIAKYNDPPVRTFLSICGCNAGVAAWPQCSPAGKLIGPVCRALAEVLGDLAYLKIVQDVLFQANYYRDPLRLKDDAYLSNSRLAHWNGESPRTRRGAPTSCEQKNSSGSRARATRSSSRATASTGPRRTRPTPGRMCRP